jgi:hypothetical protein
MACHQLFQVAKVSTLHMSNSPQSNCQLPSSSRTLCQYIKITPSSTQVPLGKHAGVKAVHYEATISNFKAGYMSLSMKIPFFRFLANSLTNNQSTKASHQSAQLKNE